MKMLQLQYFKAVAETNKISDAAKMMHVTPSAISIAIHNLELEIGVQLFDRTPVSVTLNSAGHVYLEAVNRAFETLREAESVLGGGTLVHKQGNPRTMSVGYLCEQ